MTVLAGGSRMARKLGLMNRTTSSKEDRLSWPEVVATARLRYIYKRRRICKAGHQYH